MNVPYVIVQGHRGLPCALFRVRKETPKRFYGDLADTISEGNMRNWFWLHGLVKSREPGKSYVVKDIVACPCYSIEAWHKIKDRLADIINDYNADRLAAEAILNDAREQASNDEIEARTSAKRRVKQCLEGLS